MPLSDYERHVLAQLELAFDDDHRRLARMERDVRRRQVIAGMLVPIGLLVGLASVVLGVRLGGWVGNTLAITGYLALVASCNTGLIGARRVRVKRRVRPL